MYYRELWEGTILASSYRKRVPDLAGVDRDRDFPLYMAMVSKVPGAPVS